MLDREGCGRGSQSREDLEAELEERLANWGWNSRGRAILLDPELEIWAWGDSPHLDALIGWHGRTPSLREWLNLRGYLSEGQVKPARPKEALEEALKCVRKKRSSALYEQLADKVSLERCVDAAFAKLKKVLREWFSPVRE
jgi:hypothetical protein